MSAKIILDVAQDTLMRHSMLLAHKYAPILKEHLSQKMQAEVSAGYAKINLPAVNQHNMAMMYQEAVDGWLDSDTVS